MSNKWLWRGLASVIYALAFFVVLSALHEAYGDGDDS